MKKRGLMGVLAILLCLGWVGPVYALQDGTDVSWNQANNSLFYLSAGAFYPWIKDTFYDKDGVLRTTYKGEYSGSEPAEELPGKTPVEFIAAEDMVNNRDFLGYCYREDGSLFYEIYGRIGFNARRIIRYEHPFYVNPFRSSIDCHIYQRGGENYIAFSSKNSFPEGVEDDEFYDCYRFDKNWNLTKVSDVHGDFEEITTDELYGYDEKSLAANSYKVITGLKEMKKPATQGYQHFFGEGSQEAVDEFKLALTPLFVGEIEEGRIDGRFLPGLMDLGYTSAKGMLNPENGQEKKPIGGGKDLYKEVGQELGSLDAFKGPYKLSAKPYREFFKKYYRVDLKDGTYDAVDSFETPCQVTLEGDRLQCSWNKDDYAERIVIPTFISIGDVKAYYDHAIVTVNYITNKEVWETDGVGSSYVQRRVLVKKLRGEDGKIRFIPLYINKADYSIEDAEKIMGYQFKPIYTTKVDFEALRAKDPKEWKGFLQAQLKAAGFSSGKLVDEDQVRIQRFLYDFEAEPKKQVVKKRSLVLDGQALAKMKYEERVPKDFRDYLKSIGVETKPVLRKKTLYLDMSKSPGRGLEFYLKNFDEKTFPDYLVLKKGRYFTWVLPRSSLANNVYYYINKDKNRVQVEVAMDGKKSSYVPLSFLFLDDQVKTLENSGQVLKKGQGLGGEGAFVPVKTGSYQLSKEANKKAQSGYLLLAEKNLADLGLGDQVLNRLALARLLSYTPVAPDLVPVGELKDGPQAGPDASYIKELVAQGIYGLDGGAIYPGAPVKEEDLNQLLKPVKASFPEKTPSFDHFAKEGTRVSFLEDFEPIATAYAQKTSLEVKEDTQPDFLLSLKPDKGVLETYHKLLGIKGFSLLNDMMEFPLVLLPLILLVLLAYCLLGCFRKLPGDYNLFLPETRQRIKEGRKKKKRVKTPRQGPIKNKEVKKPEEGKKDLGGPPPNLEEKPGPEEEKKKEGMKGEQAEGSNKEIPLLAGDRLAKQEEKFCSHCGQRRKEGDKFCGKCGYKFH